jgi:hypothetical protein
MIGLLVRLLSRFAFRFFLSVLIFAIGNLLGGGRQRDGSKGFRRFGGGDPGSSKPGGSGDDSGRRSGSGGARAGSRPPLNRGDAVDVPFTEVPPEGEAAPPSKPAGEPGRGS